MINYLYEHNVVTGLIWESENTEGNSRNYQLWLNKVRRTHSQLVYTTSDGGLLKGYSDKKLAELEPFAIHVRSEFGDGIYYFTASNEVDDVYFLVVNEDRIVSGSDRIVKKEFFDALMHDFSEGALSHLSVRELQRPWIEHISSLCEQRQVIIKRKQKLFIIGVTAVGVFLLALMAVLLNMMLS